MRNLLLWIGYNGLRYHGYQVQPNGATIAGTLQPVLEGILGESVQMKGCSRTDAGVHANAFAISFHTQSSIPCDSLVLALNTKLPPDIAAFLCEEKPADFHARYNAKGKRYIYKVRNSAIRNPFEDGLTLCYKHHLDEEALNKAAKAFIGTHDYSAFCSAGASTVDNVRSVYDFSVTRQGDIVTFAVVGNGFLYNMVRIMVGALLDIAAKKIKADDLPSIIASKNRGLAGKTIPPVGLYLDKVFYEDII